MPGPTTAAHVTYRGDRPGLHHLRPAVRRGGVGPQFSTSPKPILRLAPKVAQAIAEVFWSPLQSSSESDTSFAPFGGLWQQAKRSSRQPSSSRLAVAVADHLLDYGDFEGTIPKRQYVGGGVQQWDRGFWTPQGMAAEQGLVSGDLKFTLEGERLHGTWVLVRIKGWSGKRVN